MKTKPKFTVRWKAPAYPGDIEGGRDPSFFNEGRGFTCADIWEIALLDVGDTITLTEDPGIEVTREA
ncbi:hypothetical protein [Burkholderia cenocepacia]|uniref:hypothetical protein n=1 Tax=Burkholderia cenocepacia TaxID=95486 RepID=UPI00264A62EF|nr:hypothetical protein [Burkholderia cenocepacia]MDN7631044.1 hypothetical protein [Burkholderia cenocepacia]